MVGRGLKDGFAASVAISIYSCAQPTAASVVSNWTAYTTTGGSLLAHYIGASWYLPAEGPLLQLGIPAAVVAIGTGAAVTAILWSINVTAAQMALTTLPSASFIIAPCSLNSEPGVIRFADINFVAGVSKAILDGSIGSNLTV